MATTTDRAVAVPAPLRQFLPLAALAAVWLTTAGHSMNFREMDAARGWITSEGYSFHSAFLLSIALSVLIGPALSRRWSARALTLAGLALLAVGSALNGTLLHAPLSILVAGRFLAGFGVGQVLFAASRLMPADRGSAFDWCAILLPALGPLVIAGASMLYGWSSWEGGFLFEGVLALFGLACIIALPPAIDSPPVSKIEWEGQGEEVWHGPLAYWPALAGGFAALWYVMHWGHLSGWFEDRGILLVTFAGIVSFIAALWFAWPYLHVQTISEGWPRLLLIGFAGMVQFFNVSEMGAYGGLMVNFSAWQRAMLIWSVSVGTATALVVDHVFFPHRSLGRVGGVVGLLSLTAGMVLAYRTSLGWPFWNILNTVEFNWFAAPQQWQLAPARLLMGFGTGFILLSETSRSSPDPVREARIRPSLQVAQCFGGALGIGFLATALLLGHQWEYSFAADRGTIQAVEVADRQAQLGETYAAAGAADATRKAEVLMFRSVNYQADNLVFADIYGIFAVTSLVLAVVVVGWLGWDRGLSSRSHLPGGT